MSAEQMTAREIEQFLTCARVGRLGVCLENGPYVVPVAYVYADGEILFHTCSKGLKMNEIRRNPNVCFEVDEATSDTSMWKSVIISGTAQIIDAKEQMIPYLEKLIQKYRGPKNFDEYMDQIGRNREKELEAVRICLIKPKSMTGRKYVQKL